MLHFSIFDIENTEITNLNGAILVCMTTKNFATFIKGLKHVHFFDLQVSF